MDAIVRSLQFVAGRLDDWRDTRLAELQFWHRDTAWLAIILFIAVSVFVLLVRALAWGRSRPNRVGLPALLAVMKESPFAFVRHAPVVLLMAGLPFFILALADPYTSLTQKRDTFPGRRICLMIDASSSMVRYFSSPTLRTASSAKEMASEAAFSTSVAAAERFVRLRMESQYRDLMSLIEFGDQAYVVTPFTHDYDNILLSLSLISEFSEFMRFPDRGTTLARAVEQGMRLFKAFDVLEAAGNLMVIFSDGEDAGVITQGMTVTEVVNEAIAAKIPIYLVRVNRDKSLGAIIPDATWKTAVERTGGRFYAAANEATILQAIRDIDRVSAGRIDVTHYVTQRPWFGPFALSAAALWSLALLLKLTVPYFRTFP